MKTVKYGLLSGVGMLVVSLIVNFGVTAVIPSLQDMYKTAVFRPWSDPLMMLFFLYPFIIGFALAWVWPYVKDVVVGETHGKKAMSLAVAGLLLSGVPGMFATYTSFNVPLILVLLWLVSGYLEILTAGYILARWYK